MTKVTVLGAAISIPIKLSISVIIRQRLLLLIKTASRNVAFKATRMRDSIMEGQDKFVMRELDNADVGLREDCEEDLVDVGCNADIYVATHL